MKNQVTKRLNNLINISNPVLLGSCITLSTTKLHVNKAETWHVVYAQ